MRGYPAVVSDPSPLAEAVPPLSLVVTSVLALASVPVVVPLLASVPVPLPSVPALVSPPDPKVPLVASPETSPSSSEVGDVDSGRAVESNDVGSVGDSVVTD